MCFRIRASDRGKSRLVHPSYRKVLRAHELSHCANAHRRCRIFGRDGNEKFDIYTQRYANDFFKTVILLYDHPLFSCAHRIKTSAFNPPGRAYRKNGKGK